MNWSQYSLVLSQNHMGVGLRRWCDCGCVPMQQFFKKIGVSVHTFVTMNICFSWSCI